MKRRAITNNACRKMTMYANHCGVIYPLSFEKQCHYEWALRTAINEVRRGRDTPLNTLYTLLTKYDEWAHLNMPSAYKFAIAAAAVDDLIDVLLRD